MLSPPEKVALRDMCSIAAKMDIPLMLVGAGARILVFDRRYNTQGRSTTDWDWGIKVASWQEFESLAAAMVESAPSLFKRTRTLHRFEHIETQTILDLVPFGLIAEPNQAVEWPNERSMNVLGYDEALVQAEEVALEGNWTIKVANVPALIVLKLIAWNDRGGKKDLEDVSLMLQNYLTHPTNFGMVPKLIHRHEKIKSIPVKFPATIHQKISPDTPTPPAPLSTSDDDRPEFRSPVPSQHPQCHIESLIS
jgi:predicted nucleotidyltransferase